MSEPHDRPNALDDGVSQRERDEHRAQIERDRAAQSDARRLELARIAAEREELKRILAGESQQSAIEEAKQRTQEQIAIGKGRAAQEEELARATAERVEQERAQQRIAFDGAARDEALQPISAGREAQAGNRQIEFPETGAAGQSASQGPRGSAGEAAPLPAAGRGKAFRRVYGIAVALAVIAGLYLAIGTQLFGEKSPVQPMAQAPSPRTTAGAAASAPTVQEGVADPSGRNAESKMREDIQRWADAWSRKDVAAYLASYAKEFEVPGGLSRADWEAQRKSRLGKYRTITVTLREIRVSSAGEMGQAEFIQDFQTESFREIGVKKKLGLRNVEGRWLIVREEQS